MLCCYIDEVLHPNSLRCAYRAVKGLFTLLSKSDTFDIQLQTLYLPAQVSLQTLYLPAQVKLQTFYLQSFFQIKEIPNFFSLVLYIKHIVSLGFHGKNGFHCGILP